MAAEKNRTSMSKRSSAIDTAYLEKKLAEVRDQRKIVEQQRDPFAFDDIKMSPGDREFLKKIKQFERKESIIQAKLTLLQKRMDRGVSPI